MGRDSYSRLGAEHESPARKGTPEKPLEFLILSAARSAEVRKATWKEIDLSSAMWTVGSRRAHEGESRAPRPLSGRALEVLGEAAELSDGYGLIFPGMRAGANDQREHAREAASGLGFDEVRHEPTITNRRAEKRRDHWGS